MQKRILNWDADKQQYSVRFATSEDMEILNEIRGLMKQIKQFYCDVIDDARHMGISIDLFIDNECYYAWKESCEQAKRVDQLCGKIGIKLDVNRYIHTWF